MSYIFNKKIQYEDTSNLDAFGRLRVSDVTSLLEIKHIYDKQPLLVDEILSGGATSVFGNSSVTMTVSPEEYVVRQSFRTGIYQPGKSQIFEASFSNFEIQNNTIKRVGYYSSTAAAPYNSVFDGFFLQSDGINDKITFEIWRNGTNVVSADTTSWESLDYKVEDIDWSKTQLMFCDFQWLGVGRVRFYLVINGEPKLFYEYSASNNDSLVYMTKPNQFIRYEIRSVTGGNGSFVQICSQVSMEGSLNSLFKPIYIPNTGERTLATSGTIYPLIGFRFGSNFRASKVILKELSVLQTTNDNFIITIQKNPTLSSAPSWTPLTNTPLEYSQGTGAITVTSPGYILAGYMGKASTLQNDVFNFTDSAITPGFFINGTPEEHWFCITPLGNNAKFRTSLNVDFFD